MTLKRSTSQQLANCLRAVANMLDHAPVEDVVREIESSLMLVNEKLTRRDDKASAGQRQKDVAGTTAAEPSPEAIASQAALCVAEFGRDVMSDIEFPTRSALAEFARAQGVVVSDRDAKATIRQKLLSKAELKNMDHLIRRDDSKHV